ncbi:hypothetical protein [Iodidimonas muriae]|uniref:hypothetical protein n=1 Tax=Iodidimonas muriae TaxID=261467 RepID=UPI00166D1BDD|nr:hypothetical protein [Iodidimonas muriae]
MTIEIRKHLPGEAMEPFLSFPNQLYRDDAGWTPPLKTEIRKSLSPKHNPFFKHADVMFFTAWSGDRMVGRCSAQVCHEHLKKHDDKTGFFGCFDVVDSQEVATALLDAAKEWVASKGMTRLRGPFSLGVNEEIGVMIEGFDAPSMMLTPYHRPYLSGLLHSAGFEKVKEIISWRYECGNLPARAQKAYDLTVTLPEVRIRRIDKSRLDEEMAVVRSVFNDAWRDNWGYVPWTDAEFAKAVEEFRFILDPRLALIAEIDGEPVGIAICIPNLNEVIRDFDGRLGPVNLLKLLWRIKVRSPNSAKLPLMGMRKAVQKKRRYAGLATAMCVGISHGLDEMGIDWVELGWTLEDNHPVNAVITRMGAIPFKRHRIVEATITG